MKKLTCSLLLSVSLLTLFANANDNAFNLPKEFANAKKTITEEECRKYLGEENFNFIAEVYGDNMTAMLKCKNEMKK